MKNYTVRIPFTGYCDVMVDAEDEQIAIEKAFKTVDLDRDLVEMDYHQQVVEGNIFYGLQNEVDIVYVEDIEE